MNFKQLQAIFFDFDGVIVDSTRIKTNTFSKMFREFGDEIVQKVLTHHLQHGGISRVEKIATYYEDFLGKPLTREALMELCDQFSLMVTDQVVKSDWIAGAEIFLENYFAHLPLYVVSGTPEPELHEIIARRGMGHYFQEVMGSPIQKPEHVNRIIKEQGYAKNRCVFVGDALTDYHAAVETGLKFVGVQGEIQFPQGTKVIPDCTTLEKAIVEL